MSNTTNTQIKSYSQLRLEEKNKKARALKIARQLKANKKHLKTAKQFEDYTWMERFK